MENLGFKIFMGLYIVVGAALMFTVLQLHITAAQMHLHAEERYQSTLRDVCPRQPNDPHCKDLGRKNWSERYERWVVQFAL